MFQNAEELLTSLKKSPDEDRIGRNKYKTLRISIYKGKRHTEHLISSLFPKERAAWVGYNKAEETGAISTTQILDIVELTDVFPGKADSAEEGGENDQD